MPKLRLFTPISAFLLFCAGIAHAQESRTEIRVDFRANSTAIDPGYNSNARRLDEIVSFFGKMEADSTVNITSVSFRGTASPEGSYGLNKRLARGRLEALEKIVRSRISIPDSLVTRDDEYIPWEYLAGMVAESDMGDKERILAVINGKSEIVDYPGGRHVDSRVPALQRLEGGKVWNELLRRFFSPMRNASAVIVTFRKELPPAVPAVEIAEETGKRDSVAAPEFIPATADTVAEKAPAAEGWRRKLHVKSNAVGLGMGIANAAVEVDLARHWSFTLPVYYSAWNYFRSSVKFRTLAFQPEARYWFDGNNDRWFVGAHFGLAYYNFAADGKYRTQDHDGKSPALGGGVSAGYRLPVSRDNRWRVEFSLGAGVYSLHHDKFRNSGDGLLTTTEKKTYFGIDQTNISLVYTFGLGKKGGKR